MLYVATSSQNASTQPKKSLGFLEMLRKRSFYGLQVRLRRALLNCFSDRLEVMEGLSSLNLYPNLQTLNVSNTGYKIPRCDDTGPRIWDGAQIRHSSDLEPED